GGIRALAPNLPRADELDLDAPVLLFALVVSLLTTIIFGLVPALCASRGNLDAALRAGARGATAPPGRIRSRDLLVVSEVALSLVLLAGAGLLLNSFAR